MFLVAGLALAMGLQGPAGEATAQRRRSDFRHTPDPELVKVLAGAHRSTTADLFWLQTLPDLAREFADAEAKARWVDHSIDAITDLEPSFMTVYDFGQAYLSILDRSVPGSVDRAIALLEKGIRNNPRESGLYVRLALIHWMEKKDRRKTIELLDRAQDLPGFDSLSASMLARMKADDRDDLVALGMWEKPLREGSPEIRRKAELLYWRIKGEIARRAARDFEKRHGRRPRTPEEIAVPELVQAEVVPVILEGLRIDENGLPRYERSQELEMQELLLGIEESARRFRDDTGRWPRLEELGLLPAPPPGQRWALADGKASLEAAE